jgi:serine/threonine protein kinase
MSSLPGPSSGHVAHLIPRSDIHYDDSSHPLGQGGFGVVFKGTRKGGSQVAVKRLHPGMTAQSKAAFHKEVANMCSMRSEFVVPVYGIVDDSPHQPVLLIMKLMHESLHSAYSAVPPPSLWQRVKWLLQAGKGIAFLHEHSVLHRDIKPANMLLSSPETGRCLELGDFGLSKSLKDITSASMRSANSSAAVPTAATAGGVGTPHYMAPELMSVPPVYSFASDVYAFGIVMREVICMTMPFADCDDMHELKKAIRKKGYREQFPDDFPPTMRALIERAWHQDSSRRPAIGEIVLELAQFLAQLQPDSTAAVAEGSHSSSLAAADSRQKHPAPPQDSTFIDSHSLSVLFEQVTDSDFVRLVQSVSPVFERMRYGEAMLAARVKADFILTANDDDLSALFGQINIQAADRPPLREAFVSWRANPTQVLFNIAREKEVTAQRELEAERQRQAEQKRQDEQRELERQIAEEQRDAAGRWAFEDFERRHPGTSVVCHEIN